MAEQQDVELHLDTLKTGAGARMIPYERAKQTAPHIRPPDAGRAPRSIEKSSLPGCPSSEVAALEAEVARLRRAEKDLLESNDALALLSETANELLSSEKPHEVIATLFEKLSARLGLEAFFNYLVDEGKGKLHLNSYAGIPPEVAKEIEWLEYGEAIGGCVAPDRCRIIAEDIQRSEDVRTDLVRSFGITAYACHPLIAHGKVIGTFSFGTSKKPCFDPHELALMQAVCDQVGMAMERILLISELRQREEEARRAVHMRDEFLSVAAHELKTPMTSLRGFAQVLIRQFEKGKGFDEDRLYQALKVIDLQSEKLAHLVSQLLDVARIEGGRLMLQREKVEIGELARSVAEDVLAESSRHDLVLRVREPIWTLADPLRLRQVLRNLLDNAVRFSPEGGPIHLDIWSSEIGCLKMSVRDHGTGIPPERREHVFDRFYQAHSDDHCSGMGLGLYLAAQIIHLHDGKIEVEFPSDGGTRFVITLPAAPVEVKRQWQEAPIQTPTRIVDR